MTKIFPRSRSNYMETPEQITDRKLRKEIALLKQTLADRALELDFLKSALRRVEEDRQKNSIESLRLIDTRTR
jgi:hypothetical protein